MQRGTLFWGTILILLGVVFLLNTFGLFGKINVWGLIWPFFIIVLGIWMLIGSLFQRSIKKGHAAIPLEGATRAQIRVNHGAGRIRLTSNTEPGMLVSGEFGGGLDYKTNRSGDLLDVKMRVPEGMFYPWSWSQGYSLDWDFSIIRDLPLSLEIETGASESHLDLTNLQVADFRLKSGASSTEVLLPASAGSTRVDVETGAASLMMKIPLNVAARIRVRSGLSSINVDNRFARLGDSYQSSDFDTAANRVEINIETGVGSVDIR